MAFIMADHSPPTTESPLDENQAQPATQELSSSTPPSSTAPEQLGQLAHGNEASIPTQQAPDNTQQPQEQGQGQAVTSNSPPSTSPLSTSPPGDQALSTTPTGSSNPLSSSSLSSSSSNVTSAPVTKRALASIFRLGTSEERERAHSLTQEQNKERSLSGGASNSQLPPKERSLSASATPPPQQLAPYTTTTNDTTSTTPTSTTPSTTASTTQERERTPSVSQAHQQAVNKPLPTPPPTTTPPTSTPTSTTPTQPFITHPQVAVQSPPPTQPPQTQPQPPQQQAQAPQQPSPTANKHVGLNVSPRGARRGTRRSGNSTSASAAERSQQIPNLYRLLAENKLTELEIWEGDAGLFPVLYQYKEIFEKMEPVLSVVTFTLPSLPEFGGVNAQKTYKINNDLTVAQTINLICRKMGVGDPERFCLATLRRYYLNYDQPLYECTYGLGTLFEKWELRLLFKSDVANNFKSPVPAEAAEGTVVFHLPPLQEFNGLNKKVVRVDLRQRTHDLVEQFLTKHKVANPGPFVIMTGNTGAAGAQGTGETRRFVLSDNATFGDYGLGARFQKWELNLVFDALVPDFVTRQWGKPKYGWAQAEQVNIPPIEARDIIADLENVIWRNTQKANGEITDLQGQLQSTQQQLSDTQQQLADTQHKLAETNSALTSSKAHSQSLGEKLEALLQTLQATESELQETQEHLANSRAAFATISDELADTKVRLASTQDEGRTLTGNLRETNRQLEQTKRTVELRDDEIAQLKEKLEATLAELQEEKANYQSTAKQLESTTTDLETLSKTHDAVTSELDKTKFELEDTNRQRKDVQAELSHMKEMMTGKISADADKILTMENQLRETEARLHEQEARAKRDLETTKKEYGAEKRQAELKAQQEIRDLTSIFETKQVFAQKQLTTHYEGKLAESEAKLKALTGEYDDLRTQRHQLFDQIDEWLRKSVEWEEAKKAFISGKHEADKKLQATQATLEATKKAKADDERALTKTLLQLESTFAELATEKERNRSDQERYKADQQRYRTLEEQHNAYVHAVAQAAKNSGDGSKVPLPPALPPVVPPPPPSTPPPPAVASPTTAKKEAGGHSFGSFIVNKREGLRPVQPMVGQRGATQPGGGHTIADLLFASMQKRFSSISGNDDEVEELDDEATSTFE